MVDGPGRDRSHLAWFAAGALMGGATTGVLVGIAALLVPALPPIVAIALVALAAVLVLLRDTGLVAVPFPQNQRQVRQSVLQMQPASGAVMFGFELGTGARTFMTGAAPYVAIIAALVADGPGPLPAVLAGAGFGLGRGLVPIDRKLHGDWSRWEAWIGQYGRRTVPVVGTIATTITAMVSLSG
jgi:hypothetical protein